MIRVPEPTTALIIPARRPATTTASDSSSSWRREPIDHPCARPVVSSGSAGTAVLLLLDDGVQVREPAQAAYRLRHPEVAGSRSSLRDRNHQ